MKHIAGQLGITNISCLSQYLDRKPTRHEHSAEIQMHYGYHDFNETPFRTSLSRWLYSRIWLSNERPSILFYQATAWLIEHKVLLPGVTTLMRLVAQVRERVAKHLWKQLAALPNAEQKAALETLLTVPEGSRHSRLDLLRQGPTRFSSPALIAALQRYEEFRAFGISKLDFSKIPHARLKMLARYAATAWAPTVARMNEQRRLATLLAFVYVYETIALDDALDVLDMHPCPV